VACVSGGVDVLVEAEDVVGVVAALQLLQAREACIAVGGSDPLLAFVAEEVDVHAAGRVGQEGVIQLPWY
jgi:hypothetical protein